MKTAFITGASRGIGRAVALGLAELGFRVVLVAKDKVKLEQVAEEILIKFAPHEAHRPLIFPLDISKELEVARVVQKTFEITQRIDVLFNGAGIARWGSCELDSLEFLNMLEVNLMGAFYCIKHIAPLMKKQKSGYILNVSSRAGKIGIAQLGGYSASKFGLMGLNESLFNELAASGIKVTAICPGYVDTDMAASSKLAKEDKIPVADIVKIVQFLLSLSSNCCIREITAECCKTVELTNAALLTGR